MLTELQQINRPVRIHKTPPETFKENDEHHQLNADRNREVVFFENTKDVGKHECDLLSVYVILLDVLRVFYVCDDKRDGQRQWKPKQPKSLQARFYRFEEDH